jgi:hypothetical protein
MRKTQVLILILNEVNRSTVILSQPRLADEQKAAQRKGRFKAKRDKKLVVS